MSASTYLASKPTGAVLVFLIVSLVLAALAGLVSWAAPARPTPPRDLVGLLMAAAMFFFVLAFVVAE